MYVSVNKQPTSFQNKCFGVLPRICERKC